MVRSPAPSAPVRHLYRRSRHEAIEMARLRDETIRLCGPVSGLYLAQLHFDCDCMARRAVWVNLLAPGSGRRGCEDGPQFVARKEAVLSSIDCDRYRSMATATPERQAASQRRSAHRPTYRTTARIGHRNRGAACGQASSAGRLSLALAAARRGKGADVAGAEAKLAASWRRPVRPRPVGRLLRMRQRLRARLDRPVDAAGVGPSLESRGDEEGADWREVARIVLKLDVRKDPEGAKRTWASHLARAKWMTEYGYRHLLRGGAAH